MRKARVWLSKCLLATTLALGLTLPAAAQQPRKKTAAPRTTAQLERERRRNLRQIKATSQALTQTTQKKQVSLGQLNVIKEKLTVKQGQIQHISTQLRGIESNVHQTAGQVLATQARLRALKAEYGRLLYTAATTANAYNRLMFLFAAESFNQFALRLRYVRQYTEERQKQAQRIVGTQTQLKQQLSGLTVAQQRKSSLLKTQLSENQNLLTIKGQQAQMVQQLGQQEKGLREQLAEQQQAVRRLDQVIAQRVQAEIERAARAARRAARREREIASRPNRPARPERNSAGTSSENRSDDPTAAPETDAPETAAETAADRRSTRIALTPEGELASTKFSGNRGRLPWPVGRGFVSQRFGRHPHPVLKNVVIENRGVDIQTGAGEEVRSVFDGKVLTVTSIAGMNQIVMIQHGDFFTVYAKLRTVSVQEGQRVSAREPIGTVATNAEGTAEVQFQVWHNAANLNPETWLGRK